MKKIFIIVLSIVVSALVILFFTQSKSKREKIVPSKGEARGEGPLGRRTVSSVGEVALPQPMSVTGAESLKTKEVINDDLGIITNVFSGGMAAIFKPPAEWLSLQSPFVQEAVKKNNFILNDDGIFGVLDEKGVFRTWPNAPRGVTAKQRRENNPQKEKMPGMNGT